MDAINKAIAAAGGISALAREAGVSRQAIYYWQQGKRQMSVEAAIAVEHATNRAVLREELRPDIFVR